MNQGLKAQIRSSITVPARATFDDDPLVPQIARGRETRDPRRSGRRCRGLAGVESTRRRGMVRYCPGRDASALRIMQAERSPRRRRESLMMNGHAGPDGSGATGGPAAACAAARTGDEAMTSARAADRLEVPTRDDCPLWVLMFAWNHFPTLMAADELGLFPLLGGVPKTEERIRDRLSIGARACEGDAGRAGPARLGPR